MAALSLGFTDALRGLIQSCWGGSAATYCLAVARAERNRQRQSDFCRVFWSRPTIRICAIKVFPSLLPHSST